MASWEIWPITCPTWSRRTVVILSAMIQERRTSASASVGSSGTRVSGASTDTLVNGQIVTVGSASKKSD